MTRPIKSDDFCLYLGLDHGLVVTLSGDLRLTPASKKGLNWRTGINAFIGDNM
jgi:hypothetical protein